MKRHWSILGAIVALSVSLSVHADSGWTDATTIGELAPTSNNYYTVRLEVKDNPSGCEKKTWFYQEYGANGSDKMYRTVLEALKSGIRVRVYVTGKCNINGYSEISSVSVSP